MKEARNVADAPRIAPAPVFPLEECRPLHLPEGSGAQQRRSKKQWAQAAESWKVEEKVAVFSDIMERLTLPAERLGCAREELLMQLASAGARGTLPLWNRFQQFFHCTAGT